MVTINLKNKIIITALSLSMLFSTSLISNGLASSFDRESRSNKFVGENSWDRREIAEAIVAQIKELKLKVKNGQLTKEQFRYEVRQLLPEIYDNQQINKRNHKECDLPDDIKIKVKELRIRYKKGEITREEFLKEINTLITEENKDKK